jgi:hypothetical protein
MCCGTHDLRDQLALERRDKVVLAEKPEFPADLAGSFRKGQRP